VSSAGISEAQAQEAAVGYSPRTLPPSDPEARAAWDEDHADYSAAAEALAAQARENRETCRTAAIFLAILGAGGWIGLHGARGTHAAALVTVAAVLFAVGLSWGLARSPEPTRDRDGSWQSSTAAGRFMATALGAVVTCAAGLAGFVLVVWALSRVG
jgi:hypothetical protein